MAEPVCRACYAGTLTRDELERLNVEPVTSCVYLCPDHQRAMDEVVATWPLVIARADGVVR